MLPALYPFGSKERWLHVAPAFFGEELIPRLPDFLDRDLIPLIRGPEIAFYLGVSPRLVSHMVTHPHKYYASFQILKRNGKPRTIAAPRVFLKTVQRYILDCVLSQLPLHQAATGFRRGSNCALGAGQHVGCRYLWKIDIEEFFPSITQSQVTRVFETSGYPKAAAFFMSGLCCVGKRLPQGAPTSPALANLVFKSIDESLAVLAGRTKIKYTRYADDLSFSSNELIPRDFRESVISQINRAGFRLQSGKTRLMGPKTRREVTGLTVNERVGIPRFRRRQLRGYFHAIKSNPLQFVAEKKRAEGFASWLYDYHHDEGAKALAIVRAIPDPE